jgi:hypothetical protein
MLYTTTWFATTCKYVELFLQLYPNSRFFLVLFTARLQLMSTSSSNWVIPHHIFIFIYVPYIYHICIIYIIYTLYMMLHLHHILVYDNVYTHITQITNIWLQLWPKEKWYIFYLHPSWLDVCKHKFVDDSSIFWMRTIFFLELLWGVQSWEVCYIRLWHLINCKCPVLKLLYYRCESMQVAWYMART